jgi:hypothetical protein
MKLTSLVEISFRYLLGFELILSVAAVLLVGCSANNDLKKKTNNSSQNELVECADNTPITNPCKVSTNGKVITSSIGSTITAWSNDNGSSIVSGTINTGFYSSTNISFQDNELISSNILSGVNIFGVQGSAISGSGSISTCSSNGLQSSVCATSTNSYWTTTLGSNIVASVGTLSTLVPAGYYTGAQTVTMSDSDLITSNISNGVNIFGVTGSLVPAYTACTDDALNVSQCSTATNRYVTASLGNNILSWANGSALTVVSGTIPKGFYNGNVIQFTDSNLISSNIKDGISLFGVTGNFVGIVLNSNLHREPGSTMMTISDEVELGAATAYPQNSSGYRAIPRITKDKIYNLSVSTNLVNRTGWDNNCDSSTGTAGGSANSACKCGLSGSISARIVNCSTHGVIGTNATWSALQKGNSGESDWKLVTRTSSFDSGNNLSREVWRDERTGLLWSSLVSTGINWCQASGSNNITNNPAAENDPDNFCNNGTYQHVGSGPTIKAISSCLDDGENYFTEVDDIHSAINNGGKGGLSSSSNPKVYWRLPTNADYLQASLDGIRYIFQDMVNGNYEWSGTVGLTTDYAVVFHAQSGTVTEVDRRGGFGGFTLYANRCVGR